MTGDFPECTPCGDCYDGWKSVLTDMSSALDQTFYKLKNLSSQYGMYVLVLCVITWFHRFGLRLLKRYIDQYCSL